MKLLVSAQENSPSGKHVDLDEALIEKIWQDLEGRVPREQIEQTVTEIAGQFKDATVTSFVPIFIRRHVLDQLRGQQDWKSQRVVASQRVNMANAPGKCLLKGDKGANKEKWLGFFPILRRILP